MNLVIQDYDSRYAREVYELFYQTVHQVNKAHYSKIQCALWAPPATVRSLQKWDEKLGKSGTLLVFNQSRVVAFGDLQQDGYLDHFFVHHRYQGQSIGQFLMHHLVLKGGGLGLKTIFAHVSLTARPFFEAQGFECKRSQQRSIEGVSFRNFLMQKQL